MKLLTVSNAKTSKSKAQGWLTGILHLAPANTAGCGNVCPFATDGCRAACLNTAGRGGILSPGATTNAIQEARKRKTRMYFQEGGAFLSALCSDIEKLRRTAARHGLLPCVRLNGTSDIPGLASIAARLYPEVQFYDYTAIPQAWKRQRSNYALTFSRKENNEEECVRALQEGINVAVVFDTKRGRDLPSMYLGRAVIDGDASDLRFLDPQGDGLIVGLRAKGRAIKDTSGFVIRTD